MDSLIHFCRLCLQKFTGHFLLVNSDPTASGMIKHLFPGMNMDLVEKSKMCTECFKNVQFAYTMRETVIKNEQKINSNLGSILAIEENTCRFCLNTDISQARVFLYDSAYASMSVLEARCVIEIAIVDVRLEIFKKPVICNSCWQIVRMIYLFKKRCFATEKILKFYCTKNNLTSLPCREIEYISTCFNSNLQKFSKGDKHDMRANLIPKDKMAHAQQGIPTSVVNIIRPVDVYLNNFTIEDKDDTFEEDIDDIFIESPRIVKPELSNPEDVKIEVEEHKVILEEQVETLGGISKAAIEIKEEPARCLNINAKGINYQVSNEFLPGDINDCLETGGCERKSESPIKNTGVSEVNHEKNLAPVTEIQMNGSETLDNIKLPTLHDNNLNKDRKEEETIKHIDKKRKISIIKSQDFEEQTNIKNSSKNDQAETFEVVEQRTYSKSKQKKSDNNIFNRDGHQKGTIKHLKDSGDTTNFKNSQDKHEEMREHHKSIVKNPRNHKITDKIWSCIQCKYETTHKQHLNRHSLIHIKSKMLTCPTCVYSTHIQRNLNRHIMKHTSVVFFHCAHCTYSTIYKSELRCHVRRHEKHKSLKESVERKGCRSDEKVLPNNAFGFRFVNSSKNDQAETFEVVEQRTYSKSKQEKSDDNIFNRDGHQKGTIKHLKDSGDTTNCKNSQDKHEEMVEHLVKQQINKSNVARKVNKNFKETVENSDEGNSKSIVKNPRNHKITDRIWSCIQCKYETKHKQHLNRHSLIHIESPKILTCPTCVYSTHIQRNLNRHIMKHTSEFFFHCAHCNYSTIYKSHLRCHVQIHEKHKSLKESVERKGCRSDEKVLPNNAFGFRCEDCPYMTSKEAQFVTHVRTHQSSEKIFKCEECHYITTRTYSLQLHMELHKELAEKKFKCKYCSFTGRRHTHLVSHMLTHQNDFKFSCSECDYKAKRKSHLVTHVLRHQRDNKSMFQCPYCEYRSIRKEHLQSHCRNKHYDKEDIDYNKAKITVEYIDNKGSVKESKIVKCPYCCYRQKIGYTLDVHIFTAHFPSNSEQMACNHCSYKTDKRKRLIKHIDYYHPRKDRLHFSSDSEIMHCNDCLYKTKHRKLFFQHINRKHGGARKK